MEIKKSDRQTEEKNKEEIEFAIKVLEERIEINEEIMKEHDFGDCITKEIRAFKTAIEVLKDVLNAEEAEK